MVYEMAELAVGRVGILEAWKYSGETDHSVQ
jgi:hypothetical protein